jgi:hypothetical protein
MSTSLLCSQRGQVHSVPSKLQRWLILARQTLQDGGTGVPAGRVAGFTGSRVERLGEIIGDNGVTRRPHGIPAIIHN